MFFSLALNSSDSQELQSKSIFNDGWVSFGHVLGHNYAGQNPLVHIGIDCNDSYLDGCNDMFYNNAYGKRLEVEHPQTMTVYAKDDKNKQNDSFSMQIFVTRRGNSYDDKVFLIDLYRIPPR